MAIEEMKKIHLVGHQHIENRVVQKLHHLGVTQIINIKDEKKEFEQGSFEESRRLEERLSQINRILKFLNQYEKIGFLKGLLDSFLPVKAYFKKEEARHILHAFSEVGPLQKHKEIEDKIESIKIKKEQLKEEKINLFYYYRFPLSKKDLMPGKKTEIIWGLIPQRVFLRIESILSKKFKRIWYKTFKNDRKSLFLVMACFKDELPEVAKFLNNQNFQFGIFSKMQEGTFKERLKDLAEEEKSLEREAQVIKEDILKLLSEKPKLLLLHDAVSNLLKQRYISQNFSQTRATFILEGWIKASEVKILEDKLIKVFPELEVAISPAPVNSKPPIAFQNQTFIKPFEFITRLYGAPNYFEFDPTPFLTPFFALFFALCITDAGYGLVLLLLGLWLFKKMKLETEQKVVFKVFILCGLLTILVGILFGSIFCLDFDHLPRMLGFLKGFRQRFMLFDPLKNIMLFLGICLGLGVIQIYFGIFLKVVLLLKRKKIIEALFQELPWVFLLTGIVLLVSVYMAGLTPSLLPLAKIFSLGGAGALFLFAGRGTKNILMRVGKGLFALYGTVGMLGDILSYSRLLALGLATTVIGLAINIIAGLFSQVPFFGFLLGLIVVVLGHGFNIFINSLSGFAHTLRLQFVEFFTKFYEGGGEFFEPFKLENKFTKVS